MILLMTVSLSTFFFIFYNDLLSQAGLVIFIRKHQYEDQNVQLYCLNLMTNAIITWNTVYMQAVIEQLKKEGYPVLEQDLVHLSPARYEHINFYGKYLFRVTEELERKGLRPLRNP